MKSLLAAALLAAIAVTAHAQDATPQTYRLVMSYDRPGLPTPHWQIAVPPRGPATYTGKPDKGVDPGDVAFQISPAGRDRIATLLTKSNGMQPCETHVKGIANMGMKTVDYAPASGEAQHCSYNYTENKPLSEAAEYIIGISATLQAGIELDRLHRYDRLGLDAVMVRLVSDLKEGRAQEPGAIRPTLESLAGDAAVLDRVRSRAQQLLDMTKTSEVAQK